MFRLLAGVFGLLLFLVLLPVAGLVAVLWATLPPRTAEATLPGLSAPVRVAFDPDGVPFIRAASLPDTAEALGYLHARDRMFQMDLMRRTASGRVSEIAGPAALSVDEMMRVLGLRRRAEADLAGLKPETRALLDAYARGVNAWIAQRGRFAAPEFVPFGAPALWTPVDSLLWGKLMALWLTGNWRTELARLSLAGHLDPARIDELWPPDSEAGRPDAALAPGAREPRYADAARAVLAAIPRFPAPMTEPGEASDEWAVDGRHTASGKPLLAGDPHLAFGFPGLWYLTRIDVPGLSLAGATAPGLPFLVLGHNGHIAWTFTTTGADTADVFEETVLPDGKYQTPDGPSPFVTRQERIRVRGRKPVTITVRETRHGPVISDLDGRQGGPGGGPVLAVAMAALAPGDTAADGILALNQASDVAAAGRAAAMISAPVQNMLVADASGVGLFVTGRVPIRRAGDGAAPVNGASGKFDWTGFASGEALPHYVDAPSGRLVNANERVATRDFPVFMGRDWFGDWRAVRIRQLLDQGGNKLTPADFARMQVDATSTFAQALLPVLRGIELPAEAPSAKAAALLAHWDGRMAMGLPQPLIFNAWMQRFYQLVMQRAGIAHLWAAAWQEFTQWVVTPAGAHWCGGDCGPLLAQALQEAVAQLAKTQGPDPASWRWGKVHRAVFASPLLGRLPVIGSLTTARIPVPGDDTTLFRSGAPLGQLDAVHGAEFRGVYDLAKLDDSLFMAAPGQSGQVASRHAWNLLPAWRDGATIRLGPAPERTAWTMHLVPATAKSSKQR